MYHILLFSGGVYKFDQLVEYLEDVGGLLIREDRLEISRGTSFLSEEVRVLIIAPSEEIKSLKSLSKDIKGELEELEIKESQKEEFFSYLAIYSLLCRSESWLSKEMIEEMMKCSCPENACVEAGICTLDNLDRKLDKMCQLEILKMRKINGKAEYGVSR